TTLTVTSTTDSQMHNNIMAVGSRDLPPMLATGRYPLWRSWFLRYIDTIPNGDALRKCILNGLYIPTTVVVQAVAATDDSPAAPEHTTVETPMNMSPENKTYFESKKEAIHLILTGIEDEIYLTVDACQTAHEMYEAIERLQQAKMVKKEVNELCAKRLARNANPLALVTTAQANQDPYYQTSKSQKSYAPSSKPSIPTRSHTTTRYKGKDIAKPITPPSESASEEDNDLKQAQKDIDMQKNLALIAKYFKRIYKPTNNNLRTFSNLKNKNVDTTPWENVGSPVVQQSGIQCFNCKEFSHFSKECRKPKRVKDSAYHKEKMLLYKQAEKGVPLQAEQYDWLADTDEEIDEQELENDQNDVESDDDRVTLANLIANLKLDNKQTEFEKYKAFNDRTVDYDKLERQLNETLRQLAQKDIEIKEEQVQNDTVCNEQASNVFRKEREQYFEIQDLKAQLQDKNIAISELKNLIEMCKGKYVETKFDKPSVIRQPNAQRIPKPSVLGKSAPFSDSLERKYFSKPKSVPKTNGSEGLSKTVTAQTFPQTTRQAVSNTNVLKPGLYQIDTRTTQTRAPQSPQTFKNTNPCVSNSIGVNHKTNVSKPYHRSNQMKDKVVTNNSQVKLKKTQVEDHLRIPSVSNNIKSVTTCNDSLNSRTSNVNAVCATCGKCLVDYDHFACVTKMLNDMNARTKNPNIVPISTRKPKGHVNKSVATSL
nr:hypothetical protein [Tanacetum cinerariifolium]